MSDFVHADSASNNCYLHYRIIGMWPAWGKSMARGGILGERWDEVGKEEMIKGFNLEKPVCNAELTYQSRCKQPQPGLEDRGL